MATSHSEIVMENSIMSRVPHARSQTKFLFFFFRPSRESYSGLYKNVLCSYFMYTHTSALCVVQERMVFIVKRICQFAEEQKKK